MYNVLIFPSQLNQLHANEPTVILDHRQVPLSNIQ